MDRLTPAEAGAIAVRARKLLRRRLLTHRQYALLDALLWSCRASGQAVARVSYGQLQETARMARATVAAGLAALERLGLLQRTRHRVLAIGANGQRIWRQMVSSYRLVVAAEAVEFSGRTDSQAQDHIHIVEAVPGRVVQSAQEALRRVAERMLARQRARGAAHEGRLL